MTNYSIKKVAYGNGVFIAAADDRILRSTDGINWETVQISNNITENNNLNNVVFGGGKFVVGGECVTYATADNGLTWTEYLSASTFEDMAYGNGEFILSSEMNGQIMSISAETLQNTYYNTSVDMYDIAYFNDTFCGYRYDNISGRHIMYTLSADYDWVPANTSLDVEGVIFMCSAGDRLFTSSLTSITEVLGNGNYFGSSPYTYPLSGVPLHVHQANGGIYFLTTNTLENKDGVILTNDSEDPFVCACTDANGVLWIFRSNGYACHWPVYQMVKDIAYGNETYVGITDTQILNSVDGESWTPVKDFPADSETAKGMITFGNNLFVVCKKSKYYVSADGINWTENDFSGELSGLCFGDGKFYLASYDTVLSLDEETLQTSAVSDYGMATIAYLDGILYGMRILGDCVCKYNGTDWVDISHSESAYDDYRYLTAANNRLFLGTSTATYEVALDTESGYYNLITLQTSGKLVGSCGLNGRCYLLTSEGLYEDDILVMTRENSEYQSICIDSENSVSAVALGDKYYCINQYLSNPPVYNIKDVAYGNNIYIAAADDRILRSEDGLNWETVQMSCRIMTTNKLTNVVYGDGKFMVSGECFYYYSDDNGITWKGFTSAGTLERLAYGNGQFMLASPEMGQLVLFNTETLEPNWVFNTIAVEDIAFVNGKFYAIVPNASSSDLCEFNEYNSWWPVMMNLTIGESPVLKAAGERLFLGAGSETYEFIKNENGEFYQMVQCSSILGKMIDADMLIDDATMKERACIITDTSVYSVLENTTTVVNSLTDGNDYICCSTTEDGRFMLVSTGESGNVTTKYTPEELSVPFKIKNIVCKNNVYIATTDEAILKSTDAVNWISVQENVKAQKDGFTKIAYGNNTFVVLCGEYCYISTDNGNTWIQKSTFGKTTNILYRNGEFLIFYTNSKAKSLNATTFEFESTDIPSSKNAIYVDGDFYTASESTQEMYILNSSNIWASFVGSRIEGDSDYCLKEANGRVFLGTNKATYELKKNGYNFFTELTPIIGLYGNMVDVCALDGEVYILTEKGLHKETELVAAPIGDSAKFCCVKGDKISIFSDDGIALSLYQYTKGETMPDFGITDTAYGNDAFIATAGDKILKSTDGIRWRIIKNVDSGDTVNKIIFGNNVFIAFGTAHYYLSTDCGKTWIKSSRSIHFTDAAFDGTDFLLVGHSESKVRINSETFAETVFESDIPLYTVTYAYGSFYAMNDVAQSDGKYYLYKLVGNTWTNIREYYPESDGCTIRGTENHLYFSMDNKTYEVLFDLTPSEPVAYEEVEEIAGGIIDACEVMISNEPEPAMVYALSSDTDSASTIFILTSDEQGDESCQRLYENGEEKATIRSAHSAKFHRKSDTSLSVGTSDVNLLSNKTPSDNSNADDDTEEFKPAYHSGDIIKFSVITDTHGYPWGSYTANFDLGDNTTSEVAASNTNHKGMEAPRYTNSDIVLRGNHDTAYWHHEGAEKHEYLKGLQIKSYNGITIFGLDSSVNKDVFELPEEQIQEIIMKINQASFNDDIIILTHIPLFPADTNIFGESYPDFDFHNHWEGSSQNNWSSGFDEKVKPFLKILNDYNQKVSSSAFGLNYDFSNKTGSVIGCFCGHIHNYVQCYYHGIYMEAFDTNGAEEFRKTKRGENAGLYTPDTHNKSNPKHLITINTSKKEVNGYSYKPTDVQNEGWNSTGAYIKVLPNEYATDMGTSGKEKGKQAIGKHRFSNVSYPKFCKNNAGVGIYLGYSGSENDGVVYPNCNDGWWKVDDASIEGTSIHPTHIRFNSAGRLQHYSEDSHSAKEITYNEIKNYSDSTLSLTANGYIWYFINGRLRSICKSPTYTSGEIYGNSFKMVFDANGYLDKILDADGVDYRDHPDDNWIEVKEVWVYPNGVFDTSEHLIITEKDKPRIGSNMFRSSGEAKINKVINPSNPSKKYIGKEEEEENRPPLMWIRDKKNREFWLYNGRLTTLKDSDCGY